MTNNKDAGVDKILAELLKADMETTSNLIYKLFQDIQRTDTVQESTYYKIPKDMTQQNATTSMISHFYL